MALYNTSDRYNLIFGNTARKPDQTYGQESSRIYDAYSGNAVPIRRNLAAAPAMKEADLSVKKTRKRRSDHALDFDWKYTLIVTMSIFMIIAGAIFYVRGTVILHNLSGQVTELAEDKSKLLSKQTALKSEIDKATNLNEIRTYAVKKLDMVYPDKDQVIYFTDDGSDYFRQYESVD